METDGGLFQERKEISEEGEEGQGRVMVGKNEQSMKIYLYENVMIKFIILYAN